jgi:pimeloyl-ACP methyl ester carboxylesterase
MVPKGRMDLHRVRFARGLLPLSVTLGTLLGACGGGSGTDVSVTTSTASATPSSSESPAGPGITELFEGSREVSFPIAGGDGVIEGRLWGDGQTGVVLAHGMSRGTGQSDWFPFAPMLAGEGYGVLTFNFRGFCPGKEAGCSGGDVDVAENWRDIASAVDFLEEEGSQTVFVVGASMGGIASLTATSMPGVDVAGVISLSSPQWPSRYYGEDPSTDITPAVLGRIEEPKLFVAGEDDVMDGVRFAVEARSMYQAAGQPKELALLPTDLHSSFMLTGEFVFIGGEMFLTRESDVADEATERILDFIAANR